jgi:F-type H+-transporting ATPase subunit gamma
MATLIDLRRRIRSVKSTQQITKALKMVSAAKVRRAQDRMFASRPYAAKMLEVLASLATRANPEMHPLLKEKEDQNVELMLVTADRGLCGSFNANLIKAALHFLDERRNYNLSLHLV